MAYRTKGESAHKSLVLTGVAAAHASLLLLFLSGVRDVPVPRPEPASLSIVSVAADVPAPAPPPPPTLPSHVADSNRPPTETPSTLNSDPNSTATSSGGCNTLDLVSRALLNDPVAIAALLAAPPETRSVADAIVLWNEGWSAAAPPLHGPLSAVRSAVEAGLGKVPPSCQSEEVAGPRLIPVPAGERTTFVVIGSGKWMWSSLLLDTNLQPADPDALPKPIP